MSRITAYLLPILQWGRDKRLRITTRILENTLRLAEGHVGIIVVLLEPIADNLSYDEMIPRCATLREINSLIRLVSNGKYSLEDVTVLDVRVLLSKARRERWNLGDDVMGAAYRVFQAVVEEKSPEVILTLQCQTSTAKNRLARDLCGRLQEHSATGRLFIHSHNTVVIYGFHPSMYLNYKEDSTEQARLRRLLTTRFQRAFACLDTVQAQPQSTSGDLDQTYRNHRSPYSHGLNKPHTHKVSPAVRRGTFYDLY